MNYKTTLSWIVTIETPNGTSIHNYETRHEAFKVFTTIKETIEETFPEETAADFNSTGSKGDAYYGLMDKLIAVRMNKHIFESGSWALKIKERFMEDIQYEI